MDVQCLGNQGYPRSSWTWAKSGLLVVKTPWLWLAFLRGFLSGRKNHWSRSRTRTWETLVATRLMQWISLVSFIASAVGGMLRHCIGWRQSQHSVEIAGENDRHSRPLQTGELCMRLWGGCPTHCHRRRILARRAATNAEQLRTFRGGIAPSHGHEREPPWNHVCNSDRSQPWMSVHFFVHWHLASPAILSITGEIWHKRCAAKMEVGPSIHFGRRSWAGLLFTMCKSM